MATVSVGKFVSTSEAAEIIGVSRTRVIQMLGSGDLPGAKINSRAWLIERQAAEKVANKPYTTGRPRTRAR
jgi:excisionase family DNA binding protein